MRFARVAFAALVFLCAGVSQEQVRAQGRNCMAAALLDRILAKEHHEVVVATGTIGDSAAARFYVSRESRTWTLVILLPDGRACLLAAGKAFDLVKSSEKPGEPS